MRVSYLSCVFPVASVLVALRVPKQVLAVALHSVAEVAIFSPNPQFSRCFGGFLFVVGVFSRLRLNSLAALVVLPFSSDCLSYA